MKIYWGGLKNRTALLLAAILLILEVFQVRTITAYAEEDIAGEDIVSEELAEDDALGSIIYETDEAEKMRVFIGGDDVDSSDNKITVSGNNISGYSVSEDGHANGTSVELTLGNTYTMMAILSPGETDTEVDIVSSDPDVIGIGDISVDCGVYNITLLPQAEGTAQIIASATSGLYAYYNVTVTSGQYDVIRTYISGNTISGNNSVWISANNINGNGPQVYLGGDNVVATLFVEFLENVSGIGVTSVTAEDPDLLSVGDIAVSDSGDRVTAEITPLDSGWTKLDVSFSDGSTIYYDVCVNTDETEIDFHEASSISLYISGNEITQEDGTTVSCNNVSGNSIISISGNRVISGNGSLVTMAVGEAARFVAALFPQDSTDTLTLTSGDPDILEVGDIVKNEDDGTIRATLNPCKVGRTTLTADISNGCSAYFNVAIIDDLEKPELDSCSLTIGDGYIGINFYVTNVFEEMARYGHVCINDRTYKFPDPEADGSYKFTYCVNAKEMDRDVTISLYDSEDTLVELANQSAVDGKYTYSVRTYLDAVKGRNDKLGNLAKAMDTYGYCAQDYFGYDAPDSVPVVEDADFSSYRKTITGTLPHGMSYCGSSLVLGGTVAIRHYFKADDDIKVRFMTGSRYLVPVEKDGMYYVEISGIKSSELDNRYPLQITEYGSDTTCVISYSPLSYAYDAGKRSVNSKLNNLVKALYWYNVRSKEYIE